MRTTAVDTYATRNRTTDTTTVARPDPVVWGVRRRTARWR